MFAGDSSTGEFGFTVIGQPPGCVSFFVASFVPSFVDPFLRGLVLGRSFTKIEVDRRRKPSNCKDRTPSPCLSSYSETGCFGEIKGLSSFSGFFDKAREKAHDKASERPLCRCTIQSRGRWSPFPRWLTDCGFTSFATTKARRSDHRQSIRPNRSSGSGSCLRVLSAPVGHCWPPPRRAWR